MIGLMAGVLVIAVAAGLHTGCESRSASAASEETVTSAWEIGGRGGEITIAIETEVFSLLPLTALSDESTRRRVLGEAAALGVDLLTGEETPS